MGGRRSYAAADDPGAGLGLVLAQVPVTAQIAPPYGAALAGWIVLATTVITALG